MIYKVIDKTTDETPDVHKLVFTEEWAMSLAHYDVQGFMLDEDGHLYLCDDCGCFVQCPLDRFEAVSLEAERANGWISVKDRLPKLFEDVLTYDVDGKIFINWLEDLIDGTAYFTYCGKFVTHWMPLPEPPKEVEE